MLRNVYTAKDGRRRYSLNEAEKRKGRRKTSGVDIPPGFRLTNEFSELHLFKFSYFLFLFPLLYIIVSDMQLCGNDFVTKEKKNEKIKSTENTNGGADPKAAVPRPGAIPVS